MIAQPLWNIEQNIVCKYLICRACYEAKMPITHSTFRYLQAISAFGFSEVRLLFLIKIGVFKAG